MKKQKKIFYFIVCFIIFIFLVYQENKYLKQLSLIFKENQKRESAIMENIDKNYSPRKKDFYEKKESTDGI